MIIGSIYKGIKRIIEFKMPSDRQELVELHNNLLCRLSTGTVEDEKNTLKSIKEINKILK